MSLAHSFRSRVRGRSQPPPAPAFTPADLASAYQYHRADYGYSGGTWLGLVGGRHGTTPTEDNAPSLVTGSHEQAALRFDGVDDYLSFPSLGSLAAGHVFLILKIANDPPTLEKSGLWTMGIAGSDAHYPYVNGSVFEDCGRISRVNAGNPSTPLTAWHCYEALSTPTEWAVKVNGAELYRVDGANTVAFSPSPTLGRGALADVWLDGDVSERLVCSAKLSAPELANVYGYFNTTYGIAFA